MKRAFYTLTCVRKPVFHVSVNFIHFYGGSKLCFHLIGVYVNGNFHIQEFECDVLQGKKQELSRIFVRKVGDSLSGFSHDLYSHHFTYVV